MTYNERKEQMEELVAKKERGEPLTQKETRLVNLSKGMIKPGEVKNPKGRGKGVKNWSTHFKRLMGDEKLLKSIISNKPSTWEGIVEETPADVVAAGLIAVITRDVAKAVAEGKSIDKNTLRAIDILNKLGWGEKNILSVDEEQGFFQKPVINFSVIESNSPEEK